MKIPAATLNIIRNQQLQKGKHVELSRTAKQFSLGFSFFGKRAAHIVNLWSDVRRGQRRRRNKR